jgi:hypothetical protein
LTAHTAPLPAAVHDARIQFHLAEDVRQPTVPTLWSDGFDSTRRIVASTASALGLSAKDSYPSANTPGISLPGQHVGSYAVGED